MTPAKKAAPVRAPNPRCDNCSHPRSFHRRDRISHRRPCSAYGCSCKDFKKEEAEEPE